ncbi:hypothetical protein Tco_1503271 [Tanacetum coccineum]
MQLLYCFINNVHVDYAEILWEGLHYSLIHLANLIPYPRFTKIIIDYYMTENPDISCRVHDNYHRVENDDLVKNIFNSRKNKDGAGMKIHDWMVTEKLTDHYNMYVVVFWVDVPTTQSQPIESTQGTPKIPSAPSSPNPIITKGESSASHKSTVIRFHIPRRQDPETPIPIAVEVVLINLEEAINGTKNVDVDEFMSDILNNQEDPDTRIDPGSYKESPEVKNDANLVIVNANEEEEESAGDEFELRRRVKRKGLLLERQKTQADIEAMIAEAIQNERDNLRAKMISQLQLYLMMRDDEQLRNADLAIWLSLKIKFEKITTATACRPSAIRLRDYGILDLMRQSE